MVQGIEASLSARPRVLTLNPKVNRQFNCERELKHWKKEFFQIRQPGSKVMAVNRLCEFAMEMRAYWPDTRMTQIPSNPDLAPMEPITAIPKNAMPSPTKMAEFVRIETDLAKAYAPPEVVGDTYKMEQEHDGTVSFSGVVEGSNLQRMDVGAVEAGVAIPGVDEIMIDVYGYCPNPRLLMGKSLKTQLPVSVWKGPRHWRLPQKILCRKDPDSPHYTPV